MFKVLVHRKARREIASLPEGDRIRLLTATKEMGSDPFVGDVKPLRPLTLSTAEAGRFLLLG
jgi:mRNA-degrading endonuclease RelE of RelBE toxin-antitoxin system